MIDKKRIPTTIVGITPTANKPAPTVITNTSPTKGEQTSKREPTIIGKGQHVGESTSVPSPTSVTTPRPAIPNRVPVTLPGKAHRPIQVSIHELKQAFPEVSHAVLEYVVKILAETFPDTLTSVSCSEWGLESQRKYSDLTNTSLRVISAPHLKDGVAYTRRLQEILRNLNHAFGEYNSPTGIFGFLRSSPTPGEILDAHRPEISQIQSLLQDILPYLRELQTSIERINTSAETLVEETSAWSIAALYLANILPADGPSNDLITQSHSLVAITADIQQGILSRKTIADQVNALADRIQEVILRALPSWMETIATMLIQKSLTPTDRHMIQNGAQDIMRRLHPEP